MLWRYSRNLIGLETIHNLLTKAQKMELPIIPLFPLISDYDAYFAILAMFSISCPFSPALGLVLITNSPFPF